MVVLGLARAAAWAMMPKLVVQYSSAAAALRHLRSIKMGYRTQNFYKDWWLWETRSKTAKALKRLPSGVRIPLKLVVRTKELYPERYRYRIHMRYPGVRVGEVGVKTIDVFAKDLLSVDEVKSKAESRRDIFMLTYDVAEQPTLQIVEVFERGSVQ